MTLLRSVEGCFVVKCPKPSVKTSKKLFVKAISEASAALKGVTGSNMPLAMMMPLCGVVNPVNFDVSYTSLHLGVHVSLS